MEYVPLIVVGALAALFLWGAVSPRTQWRLLVSWTHRDPHMSEPSGSAYTIHRIIAALGVVGLGIGGSIAWDRYQASLPVPPEPPSPVSIMWGDPHPFVLDRLVIPTVTPPSGRVAVAPRAYQAVDGERRQPAYLFSLDKLPASLGADDEDIVGIDAGPGLAALDRASVVLHVVADPACVPTHVMALEEDGVIRVAVYFEHAALADGTDPEEVAPCQERPIDGVPMLLPMSLAQPLGDRVIADLSGMPLRRAPVVTG